MATYIKTLKNKIGDIIAPRTKVSAISDDSSVALQTLLNEKAPTASPTFTGSISSASSGVLVGNWGGAVKGYLAQDGSGFGLMNPSGSFIAKISGGTDDLELPRGKLKFPATQLPSADVNTLDDYEEGTFNVIDESGAGLTFTYTGLGYYVKIGKLVTIRFDITFPTTADSAFAYIGYPFPRVTDFCGAIGYHTVGYPIMLYGGNFYDVNGNARTNAQLSGKRITGTLTYVATA